MKIIHSIPGIVLLLLLAAGCKDPYHPDLKEPNRQVLVVEGYISGNTITSIRLSRTYMITYPDTVYVKYEQNASVAVEDQQGNKFPLLDQGNGWYQNRLYLDPLGTYRLHILTADGKEYASAYVPYMTSPPIGGASYEREGNAVNINVNTTGTPGKNAYFRWAYTETYEYHSAYITQWKYVKEDTSIVHRNDEVHICWMTLPSQEIIIGANAGLNGNEVRDQIMKTIYANDERLDVLYSMDIEQYALDSLGFYFWEAMKKNSQDIGGIYSPQPSNVHGNMVCITDTQEPVIGYIGAGTVYHHRIFVPKMWEYNEACLPVKVPNQKDSLEYYFAGTFTNIPFAPVVNPPADTVGWMGAYQSCVDCTKKGGTNIKPAYWP